MAEPARLIGAAASPAHPPSPRLAPRRRPALFADYLPDQPIGTPDPAARRAEIADQVAAAIFVGLVLVLPLAMLLGSPA